MYIFLLVLKTVKPNCTIVRREVDDEDGLVCSAIGNPSGVDFAWSLKSENESLDASMAKQQDSSSSFLPLDGSFIESRTYICVANNTVGKGTYCEIEVAGKFFFTNICVQHQ